MTAEDERERYVFSMREAFPAGDRLAAFVVSFSAGLNDLLFVNRLLVPEEEPLIEQDLLNGETLYLLRSSSSHIWELLALLREADEDEEVRAFLDGLGREAQEHLTRLRRINDPPENDSEAQRIRKTLKRTRNETWHYSHLKDSLLEKTLDRLARYRGVLIAGELMPSLRASFADDVMFVLMTEWTKEENLFSEFASQLADLTVSLIHLAQYVIDAYFGGRVTTRHYAACLEIPSDEIPAFEWPDTTIGKALATGPEGDGDE